VGARERRSTALSERCFSGEVESLSWDEFKDDIGCGWSLVKWIFLIILVIVIIGSCIEEWKDIF